MPRSPPTHAPPDPRRRALLRLAPAGAAIGLGLPAAVDAADADATNRLLGARLAGQRGVGLLAVQVQGPQIEVAVQGLARIDPPLALRSDALFEIGSITKTFTALLLADAVVSGTLKLDDAVQDALPAGIALRDSAGAPIRWIDLATHRSGLPRLPANMAPTTPADPYVGYQEADLLEYLKVFKPDVARGSRYEYSNLGFGLLGYALGRVAGSGYPQLLAERVLQPLGLTDTHLALPGRRFDRLADGHDVQRHAVPHWHFDVLAGAGALVMSGATLGRYAQAAIGVIDTPLREAFLLAGREHAPGPAPINPIGLAWLIAPFDGRRLLNHDGATAGFSSSLWLDPGQGRAIAVLANAFVETTDLATHLLDDRLPLKAVSSTSPAAIDLPVERLAALTGSYALKPGFEITISLRDGGLWAQATGQGPFRIFAAAPRRFFARVAPISLEFDDAPVPASFTLQQSGNTLRFVRQ